MFVILFIVHVFMFFTCLLLQNQFVMDEVSAIIKESVETVIGGNAYTSAKVNTWTAQVVESVLSNLSKLNKTFKYIG